MNKSDELNLSTLAPTPGSKHRRKRLGFGEGSGLGKTCGKGNKGHRARSGYKSTPGFEGGQMPLHRRLPKVGFTSRKRVEGVNVYSLLSIQKINELLEEVSDGIISIELLKEKGLVRSCAPKVKILGKDKINKKVTIEAHAISEGARAAVEAAGGVVQIVTKL
ncbi:MAG TPA: 50S ribosomal protein L15 [Oligoflexia bacterium]|nr:50S ribosomal protein L15 [Oligoflexia bacterium]HMP49802.1 50S ribosomal protein L15 [Oligoflexia bacterium]